MENERDRVRLFYIYKIYVHLWLGMKTIRNDRNCYCNTENEKDRVRIFYIYKINKIKYDEKQLYN